MRGLDGATVAAGVELDTLEEVIVDARLLQVQSDYQTNTSHLENSDTR